VSDLIFCIDAILPSFFLILLGFFFRRIGLVNSVGVKQLNKISFFMLMPVMTFKSTCESDFSRDFDLRIMFVAVLCIAFSMISMRFIAPRFTDRRGTIGVMIQGAYRSNAAAMGLPLAINFCGEAGAGPAAALAVFTVPAYNIVAVMLFSIYNDKEKTMPHFKTVAKKVITNPLIVAFLLGLVINFTGLTLPVPIHKTVLSINSAAFAMSLFIVGTQIDLDNAINNIKLSSIVIAFRMVITPLLGITVAILLGLRGPLLCAPFFILAAPCAAGCVALAESMDADGPLAAELVALSSAISVFTIFTGAYLLKSTGLI